MLRKGVSQVFVMAIVAMLGLAISIVIFFFFFGNIFIITPILQENEVQRHSIILANIYLSSEKLTYFDGYRSYRGVFDKSKLDNEMVNQGNALSFSDVFQKSDLLQEDSYPNSVVTITVTDVENNNEWYLSGTGNIQASGTAAQSFFQCMVSHIKIDSASIFRALRPTPGPYLPGTPYDFLLTPVKAFYTDYDLQACEQVLQSKGGIVSDATFPVSIRYSDNDIHMGILSLSLSEV